MIFLAHDTTAISKCQVAIMVLGNDLGLANKRRYNSTALAHQSAGLLHISNVGTFLSRKLSGNNF